MYFGDVFVFDSSCCFASGLLVFREARVVGSEDAHMFDDDFVGFSPKAVDFEATQGQHFVVAFAIVDGDEVCEELLFRGKGSISSDPILGVSHLNVIINCWIIIKID